MSQGKTQVAVMFGGRSTEHEVSIITALQVMDAFDSSRFDVIPVYIDGQGEWFTSPALRKRSNYMLSNEIKKTLTRVMLSGNRQSALIEKSPPKSLFGRKEAREIPIDVFFPAFHGAFGEDGCIQGFLQFIGAAYVGSGPRAAAIGMNKYTAKRLLETQGVAVLPDRLIEQHQWDPNQADQTAKSIIEALDLPVIVKPGNLGSSIAISTAYTEEELMISLAGAFAFDQQVLVEPFLQDMYELNCSVLEDRPPRLSAIERPKREDAVLTFEQKYMKDTSKTKTTGSQGMASLQRDLDPQDVPEAIKQTVRDYSQTAFATLGCAGVVRIDYLIDKNEEKVYFNEINTLPGSFSYYLWEAADPRLSFTELLSYLVDKAVERQQREQNVRQLAESKLF